eukprot:3143848-Pyramimonas_sp.AAC.1
MPPRGARQLPCAEPLVCATLRTLQTTKVAASRGPARAGEEPDQAMRLFQLANPPGLVELV